MRKQTRVCLSFFFMYAVLSSRVDLKCTVIFIDRAKKMKCTFILLVQTILMKRSIDKMSFYVYETGETITATQRPIVIITSNNEKELPDAFLRRCFFHYIEFPDEATMREIISVHFPNISATLVNEALQVFFKLREIPNLKKPPSTSELIDWLSLLMADDMPEDVLRNRDTSKAIPPLYGALIKNEQDVQLLERLAFMSRR